MDWFCLVLGLVWRDVVLSLMTLTSVVMLNAYVSLVYCVCVCMFG